MFTYKYNRFPWLTENQFIDRYGQLRDLPKGAEVTPRIGVFGITLNSNGNLLVASPPHALDMSGLPGGGREGVETHVQALQREYFEEVGPYFVLKGKPWPVHQQRILYFAGDKNEYWRYEQYFYRVTVHHPKMRSSPWATPEGGRAAWMPLREYHRVTASHRPAIEIYLKKIKV
ncbi:MAG: NUDIX domain-containing protein [Gammaproteobacteria bacterium]